MLVKTRRFKMNMEALIGDTSESAQADQADQAGPTLTD